MMRRSRGRGNGGSTPNGSGSNSGGGNGGMNRRSGGAPNRHQIFDSNGPDVRIRGTAYQVFEKYQALARDAQSAGDRVKAENLLQHAEHYYRIILEIQEAMGDSATQMRQRPQAAQGAESGFGSEDQPSLVSDQPSGEAETVSTGGAAAVQDLAQMPQPEISEKTVVVLSEAAVA